MEIGFDLSGFDIQNGLGCYFVQAGELSGRIQSFADQGAAHDKTYGLSRLQGAWKEVLKELKLGIPNSQTVKAFPCKRPLYLSHKVALYCELAVVVFLHVMIQTFFIHWTIHQLELTYLLLNPGFTKSDLVELVIVTRHFRYLWLLNNQRWRPPFDLWLCSLTSIYGSHETGIQANASVQFLL